MGLPKWRSGWIPTVGPQPRVKSNERGGCPVPFSSLAKDGRMKTRCHEGDVTVERYVFEFPPLHI